MTKQELILKVLEDKEIRDWYETEHDADIYDKVLNATPQELRTYGLDSIGDLVDEILQSGVDSEIISEDALEDAE